MYKNLLHVISFSTYKIINKQQQNANNNAEEYFSLKLYTRKRKRKKHSEMHPTMAKCISCHAFLVVFPFLREESSTLQLVTHCQTSTKQYPSTIKSHAISKEID